MYAFRFINDFDELNESLREIDASVDPGDWVYPAFLNSWTHYGAPYESCRFRRDGVGIVHLAGVVATGTIGQPIFRLPTLHKPEGELLFAVPSNGVFGILTVQTDGDVICTTGNNTYVSLSGVYFRTRQ